MRVLWLAVIYGVPIIVIAHWSINTWVQHERTTLTRLLVLLHLTFLSMLVSVFAIEVLPGADAHAVAVLAIGTLGALLAAMSTHLHFKVLGWMDRWPRPLGVALAYGWMIPALWTLLTGKNLYNVVRFLRRGFWVSPVYNRPFHIALWIGVALATGFIAALATIYRRRRQDPGAATIAGLIWGAAGLSASLLGLGALLPKLPPAWVPPYPYLIGMLIWLVAVRVTIVRFAWLPSDIRRYQSLFALSPTPIVMVNRAGRIIEQNPAASLAIGADPPSWEDLCSRAMGPEEWNRYRSAWHRHAPIQGWELLLPDPEGRLRTMLVDGQYLNIGDRPYCILSLHDHTQERMAQQALLQLANQDSLTGLLNRRAFERQMEESLHDRTSEWAGFAVLFVDLDGFKIINDRWGHLTGDKALQIIADRLQSVLRPPTVIARFGGDEFLCLVPDIHSAEGAAAIRQRIIRECSAPIAMPDGQSFPIAFSIGWSRYPDDAREVQPLLAQADAHMYRVKRQQATPRIVPPQSVEESVIE